jgi:hypothetical protein
LCGLSRTELVLWPRQSWRTHATPCHRQLQHLSDPARSLARRFTSFAHECRLDGWVPSRRCEC